jgi:hypothetical protein
LRRERLADGGFEKERGKVKTLLRRKTNPDQGGVGLPLVGNETVAENQPKNLEFRLDRGRPSHGRRGGAERGQRGLTPAGKADSLSDR